MAPAQLFAVVMVLIAAAFEALSNVLQHKATNSLGPAPSGAGEASAIMRTLKKPLFLLGLLLMIVGYAFHIVSLQFGILAVIQVIFILQLVFILPFSRWISKVKVPGKDWLGALVTTVGIGMFVVVAAPTAGDKIPTNAEWVLAIVIILAICLAFIFTGYRFHGTARAALIGVAGGVINGMVAPMTKVAFHGSVAEIFTNWLFYVTIVAAILGVLFPLMAFRSGPITSSFPAVMSLNPITATILGVWLFGEVLQSGFVPLALMITSSLIIFGGIIWLSRSDAIAAAFEESEGHLSGGTTEAATIL